MAAPEAPLYYQGVARTSPAFRLLKQMGWQEGEGLGKEKQGITEHVRVSKKKDNSGVGVDAQQRAASNWTFNTSAFDSILKNLKVIAADSNEKDEKKDDVVDETVEEIKEKDKKSSVKKVTRPQGRYKSRESGKILQGKSQADLDAILGYGVKPKEVWSGTVSKSGAQCAVPEPTSNSENASHHSDEGMEKSIHTLQKKPSKSNLAEKPAAENPKIEKSEMQQTVKSNLADWWGTKYGFVRAGEMGKIGTKGTGSAEKSNGDVSKNSQANCRKSFCEQDQENLYNLVQDKATKGRQGLGIADRPKKIGGAHWKGQKVVLDSDDDDENEDDNEGSLSEDPMDADEGSVPNNTNESNQRAASMDSDEDIKEPKTKKARHEDQQSWKKKCKQILKEAPGQTMSIKRLLKQIVENTDLFSTDNNTDFSEQLGLFKEKINKSSKFAIQGKKVSLA